MARIMISPSKYVQAPGLLAQAGAYVQPLGSKVLVLISNGGIRRFGGMLEASLAEANVESVFVPFGGGKIFDTAKAAACSTGLPVIIVPTIASTDVPCSALSVVYSEDGVFEEYLFFPKNPDLVLVDSEIIARSPVRLTVAGMGDALGRAAKLNL